MELETNCSVTEKESRDVHGQPPGRHVVWLLLWNCGICSLSYLRSKNTIDNLNEKKKTQIPHFCYKWSIASLTSHMLLLTMNCTLISLHYEQMFEE